MTAYSLEVNTRSSSDFHFELTDSAETFSHHVNMALIDAPLWYIQEWFATKEMIQRDLVTKLDWLPAKAHKVWHGVQEPRVSELHEIADLLKIRPYELLMHPDDASKLRRLEAALKEVALEAPSVRGQPSPQSTDAPLRRKAG
jgi:hypothetical protein